MISTAFVANERPDPFQLVLERLDSLGCNPKKRHGRAARAKCPAHPDAQPSLGITGRDDRVLMHCFAGCKQHEIVEALGLRYADLYVYRAGERPAPEIVAEYDYCDLNGVILAQKTRTTHKTFRWRTPQGTGWRSGLRGAVGLYRLPELVEARQVLVVEGEKSVDRLTGLRWAATCGPYGASKWVDVWSEELWQLGCAEVVILPDADQAGRKFARRVAESCYGCSRSPQSDDRDSSAPWAQWPDASLTDGAVASLKVKLIELPDLAPGQDVHDFLDQRSADDLRQVIADAPYWYPGFDEEQRLQRRRAKGLARQRAFRERQRAARNAANVRARFRIGESQAVTLRTSVTPSNCNACNAVTLRERTSIYFTNPVRYWDWRDVLREVA